MRNTSGQSEANCLFPLCSERCARSPLVTAVNNKADTFVEKALPYFSNLRLQRFRIFLSHSGAQKYGIADQIYQGFRPDRASVFFDDRALAPGGHPALHILFCALTCDIGIAVLSESFLV